MDLSQDTITRLKEFKNSDKYFNLSPETQARLDKVFSDTNVNITEEPEKVTTLGRIGEVVGGTVGAGVLGYGGLKLGKFAAKQTGDILRRMADIETKDIKYLKERGPEKIFTPAKEQVDYLGSNLTPHATDIVKGQVQSLDDYFEQVIDSVPDSTKVPNVKATRQELHKSLGSLGFEKKGKPTKLLREPAVANTTYRRLYDIEDFLKKNEKTLTKGQVELVRDALNKIIKDDPASVIAQKVKNALYIDLENSGVENLGRAVKGYKIAREIEKFGDDKKMYALLKKASNPTTREMARKELQQIIPQYADEIVANAKDFALAQKFSIGRLYPSGPGWQRMISRPVLKTYYEKIYPTIAKGKQLVGKFGKVLRPAGKTLGVSLQGLNYLSQIPTMGKVARGEPGVYGANIFGMTTELDPELYDKYHNLGLISDEDWYKLKYGSGA